ncbi:L-rhamnonate dehydratase [Prosthecomicrobium pneumaticum]|uniref:L-rhamnonate dehydratase n=1 Tax=Prosthecomicrobium pneumaticum TaxID=81895 RepID=A0A7W9FPQ5_9HYPH|nr:L-rhamnonate dehydratase [Prosthecomicrobium pneumaticum]MBB5754516.1 L-rhamnonate dehydratase [Prosthecomicrobium pneumaticum]
MSRSFTITDLRVYTVGQTAKGGDYFQQNEGHWVIDSLIANPMSGYPKYRERRSSWGIGVLGSLVVEVETAEGVVGVATGHGGVPAAWLIKNHFARFIVGEDARNLNRIWDELFRASLPYGRKGLPLMAISAVDLAIWDLVGKVREEPVYNLIGGLSRDEISFYCTGPAPDAVKALGFWGAKVPLPYSHFDGEEGLRKNIEYLATQRALVGTAYPLMVDCYMALTAPYAIRLAEAAKHLDIYWWEEVLAPDDVEGFRLIKQAHPTVKWTTGEHEYSRYGFRRLIEERTLDILQPDVMWVGGLTELLRIAAHASAYDIPVVPHGSGPYSYHFIASQTGAAFCEYVAASPDGRSIRPVFGDLFVGEDLPKEGKLKVSAAPGFGMELATRATLTPF